MSAVAGAAAKNRVELSERTASGRCEIEPAVMCAVQVIPYARLMAAAVSGHPSSAWLPVKWFRWWAGSVVEERGGGVALAVELVLKGQQSDGCTEDPDPIED